MRAQHSSPDGFDGAPGLPPPGPLPPPTPDHIRSSALPSPGRWNRPDGSTGTRDLPTSGYAALSGLTSGPPPRPPLLQVSASGGSALGEPPARQSHRQESPPSGQGGRSPQSSERLVDEFRALRQGVEKYRPPGR